MGENGEKGDEGEKGMTGDKVSNLWQMIPSERGSN